MQIIELLNKLQYETVSASFYQSINMWNEWYKGKVDSFHNYEVYNGRDYVKLEKYSLGMAKTVCEDWANYIFNKDTKITAETNDEKLQEELLRLNFFEKMTENIESAFCEGTSAVTIITDKDGIIDLNYINDANMIYPLSWNNGQIINCCFGSYKFFFGKKYLYLNFHEWDIEERRNKWRISNRFFKIDEAGNIGSETKFDDVEEVLYSDVKRYFTFSPAVRNNLSEHNPMGISIFANAIDQIKGIDTVYDSYVNEFIMGRKRILASTNIMHTDQKDGRERPVFDPRSTVFHALPQNIAGDVIVKEIDMKLRVQEHKDGLQDMLNALSVKIGMGTKHYSFLSGTVTATEVRSSTDTLYNSMIKHETRLEATLRGVCESILYLLGHKGDTVSVEFSDSVIHDQNAEVVVNLQLQDRGIVSKAEVRSWWTGEETDVAADKVKEIEKEMAGQLSFNEEQFSNPVI